MIFYKEYTGIFFFHILTYESDIFFKERISFIEPVFPYWKMESTRTEKEKLSNSKFSRKKSWEK